MSSANSLGDPVYPVVFLDALRVKIRDDGLVKNKAVYVALGLNVDGEKEVLGLWIEQTEGAKFWLKVLNDLKTRGVQDILVAVVDGLKGFPEAITTVYPETVVQTCIVHLIRNSLAFVSWEDRKALIPALKAIYQAAARFRGITALRTHSRAMLPMISADEDGSQKSSCKGWPPATAYGGIGLDKTIYVSICSATKSMVGCHR